MRILASHVLISGVCLLFCVFDSAPGGAVTVVPQTGDVRISTDHGFRRIESPSDVPVSTSVLVAPGGRAVISYSETCKIEVRSFATIQKEPPCGEFDQPAHFGYEQSSSNVPSDVDYDFTPKVGGVRSRSTPKNTDNCVFDHHSLLIIGGVAVVGGLAAILLSGGDDDPKPASP